MILRQESFRRAVSHVSIRFYLGQPSFKGLYDGAAVGAADRHWSGSVELLRSAAPNAATISCQLHHNLVVHFLELVNHQLPSVVVRRRGRGAARDGPSSPWETGEERACWIHTIFPVIFPLFPVIFHFFRYCSVISGNRPFFSVPVRFFSVPVHFFPVNLVFLNLRQGSQ